jgi:hypothetical protein
MKPKLILCLALVLVGRSAVVHADANVSNVTLLPPAVAVTNYQAGKYDDKVLKILREMSKALPLRTTTLKEIAPKYVIAKHEGLTWPEAVAEANARFGQRQPERAAFLRLYLEKGLPEEQLKELQLADFMVATETGAGTGKALVFGRYDEPEAKIDYGVGISNLIGEVEFSLCGIEIKGVTYEELTFDASNHLISASRNFPPEQGGMGVFIQMNTSGEGGVNYYSALIADVTGEESETIGYTPELVISERWVSVHNGIRFSEIYENGHLRKRLHYGQRQEQYGTETFVERTETFQ